MRAPALLAALAAAPAIAAEGPFADGPHLTFDCRFDGSATEGWHPGPLSFRFDWDRATGAAGPGDAPEAMREIEGHRLRDGAQYVAHFGPAPVSEDSRFDPRLSTALLSIRATGAAVLTEHSIVYGDVKALTRTGTCRPAETEESEP